jgi:hypothetical protein
VVQVLEGDISGWPRNPDPSPKLSDDAEHATDDLVTLVRGDNSDRGHLVRRQYDTLKGVCKADMERA